MALQAYLVGLKPDHLLAKILEPKDLVQVNMMVPLFSPDLKVWKTSLLEKFLVTGSIGGKSRPHRTRINFLRFKVLCPEDETEEE